MSPERWQKIRSILDDVSEATYGRRWEVLAHACGDDLELRQEVISFLDLDGDFDDFMESPLWTGGASAVTQTAAENAPTEDPIVGRRIGPYRLEKLLGRGGMGAVYLAVREDDYQQRAALKVVSWGTESEEIHARFYNERQILARLQHPGIARLLDGGTTDDGRPYLVMEYVEGLAIDRYCELHELSIRQRLELFREVCAAVQFAHQNLVIHRDLKATNILVTDDGHPRLLDFGIAKLLEPQLAAQQLATIPGKLMLTPAYASPEQLLDEQVTTASDVYALGVLLYGLLAGRLPFRVDERGYSELIQAICKRDPPKPSLVALSPPAAAVNEPTGTSASAGPTREPDPPPLAEAAATRRLRRQLAGDLDAIILKSLRKLPQERYGSATELAEDIRRHLEGLPVRARQGARLYRLRRTLRRNWLSLTVMGIVVSFAASSTILWRQAVRERTHAESQRVRAEQEQMRAVREQERAEEISSFLEDLFASADPEKMSQDPRVSEILEIGEARVLSDLGDKPELQAELLGTLGTVYQNLGQFDRARELKEAGLDRRRSSDPAPRAELAKDLNNLASLHYSQRDYAAAEARFRESLALWQQLELPAKDLAHLRNNLASALLQLARYDEAEGHLQQVLEAYREHFGAASSEVGTCLYSLATLYSNRGELEQAEPLLRRALAIQVELYGPSHPRVAGVLGSLGWLLYVKGELVEARDFLQRVLAIRSSRLDAQHSRVVAAKKSLAAVLLEQGELETARRLLDEVLAVLRRSAAEGSWALADAESLWGVYLTRLARYAEAEPYLIESLVAIRGMRGDRSIDTRIATDRVVGLYEAWGRPDRADRYRAQATPGA